MKNNDTIETSYYRRGNGEDVIVHTCFQGSDGLFQVGDKRLSEEEIDKLISITPEHRWIIVKNPVPAHFDIAKLSSRLLQKICVGVELNETDKQEIISAAK